MQVFIVKSLTFNTFIFFAGFAATAFTVFFTPSFTPSFAPSFSIGPAPALKKRLLLKKKYFLHFSRFFSYYFASMLQPPYTTPSIGAIPPAFFRLFDICNSAPRSESFKLSFYDLKRKILFDYSHVSGYDVQKLFSSPTTFYKGITNTPYNISLARFELNQKIFHVPAGIVDLAGEVIEPYYHAFPDQGNKMVFENTIRGLISHDGTAPLNFNYYYAYYLLLYRFSILSFAESWVLKKPRSLHHQTTGYECIIKHGGVRAGLAAYFGVENLDEYITAEDFQYNVD